MPWLRSEDAAPYPCFSTAWYPCHMTVTIEDAVDRLRARVAAGGYLPDGKVGTYLSLTSELAVPEKKLKAAIAVLQDEGVLTVLRGRGGIYLAERPQIRLCPLGNHYVPMTDFGTSASTKNPDGRQAYCRPCARLNSQLRWHNMTLAEYQSMLAAQEGKCGICRETMEVPEIDHDHECCPSNRSCGKCTRELLCTDCNRMIGWSRDNADRMIAGAAYVLQWKGVVDDALAS